MSVGKHHLVPQSIFWVGEHQKSLFHHDYSNGHNFDPWFYLLTLQIHQNCMLHQNFSNYVKIIWCNQIFILKPCLECKYYELHGNPTSQCECACQSKELFLSCPLTHFPHLGCMFESWHALASFPTHFLSYAPTLVTSPSLRLQHLTNFSITIL